ncbi:MAG: flagellar basal body rod C-terminal domain-containing protein [[Clostridium] cellulosi]
MANEMVNLIVSQRGYQLNANVVTTADQIEQMINDLNA